MTHGRRMGVGKTVGKSSGKGSSEQEGLNDHTTNPRTENCATKKNSNWRRREVGADGAKAARSVAYLNILSIEQLPKRTGQLEWKLLALAG